jgi:hypothetical protein
VAPLAKHKMDEAGYSFFYSFLKKNFFFDKNEVSKTNFSLVISVTVAELKITSIFLILNNYQSLFNIIIYLLLNIILLLLLNIILFL